MSKVEMKFVNSKGEYVARDSADVAFQVNPGDSEAHALVEALKKADDGATPESKPLSLGTANAVGATVKK